MDINATLLGHVIWFAVFIWITMKYIWPPLQKAMHERQEEIAGGLAAAEQGRRDLEEAEKKSQDVIADARANAAEIIGQAEKRGAEVVEEAKTTAHAEAERILEGAKADIDQELSRAKEELRSQLSFLVIAGTEKILKQEVDKAQHKKILMELEEEFN